MDIICTLKDIKTGEKRNISFPARFEEVLGVFGISPGEELEYIVIDSTNDLVGENDSIDLINKFAEMVEDVDDDLIIAINEVEGYTVSDFVKFDINFDNCTLLAEVDSQRDLGRYYVDNIGLSNLPKDTLESYFDYEAYGRDIDINNQGGFSSYGYLEVR